MAHSSYQLDEFTWLDTETLTLSTVVDNKTVEKQPLFEDEGEETIKDTETEEWVIKQDSRTDPFLSPDLPFNPIPEDAKLLLQMSIPGYLYNLQDIRERQADLHKKEASFFIPLAIQVLHATFTEPTDNVSRSKYDRTIGNLLRYLLQDTMTRFTLRLFIKKVRRADTWI